ncbi:OsmC family protein [Limibacter armeniacum]|uniref:OsmC family protein n=1 Tax=Limibacter armeniacum TaxID=466084 RepID=UPI002FE5E06A
MNREHKYSSNIQWTGNKGEGTLNYSAFERSYTISTENKPDILGSSDPSFKGDNTKYNPEELLLTSIAACHMLWYLHLCSEAGVVVVNYVDHPTGTMVETIGGSGHFSEVILNPIVKVSKYSMIEKANELHKKANELCFIANSVNFKVAHQPTCIIE